MEYSTGDTSRRRRLYDNGITLCTLRFGRYDAKGAACKGGSTKSSSDAAPFPTTQGDEKGGEEIK